MAGNTVSPPSAEVVKDVMADMTDEELMEKYGLSSEELAQLFEQSVEEGFITRHELGHRKSAEILTEPKPRSKSIGGIVVSALILGSGLTWLLFGIYSPKFAKLGSIPYFVSAGIVVSAILIFIRSLLPGRTFWRWVLTVIAALLLGSIIQSIPGGNRLQGNQGAVWIHIIVGVVLLYFGLRTEIPVPTKQESTRTRCPYCNGEIAVRAHQCNHCRRTL